MKTERKITQIAITNIGVQNAFGVIALCNDGTAWTLGERWEPLPPIPQPDQTEGGAL